MNSEWYPIETAPKNGAHILSYYETGEVFITWWAEERNGWVSDFSLENGSVENPVKWSVLPIVPQEVFDAYAESQRKLYESIEAMDQKI